VWWLARPVVCVAAKRLDVAEQPTAASIGGGAGEVFVYGVDQLLDREVSVVVGVHLLRPRSTPGRGRAIAGWRAPHAGDVDTPRRVAICLRVIPGSASRVGGELPGDGRRAREPS
jgi:hypothetical protein